ncbi:hypothetical protein AKJ16_DCAP01055 [Drosera capensis]
MSTIAAKVAEVGSGRAICASSWQEMVCRETTDDGKELFFDHGAPYFTASQPDIPRLVQEWVSKGIVAQWDEVHGTFGSTSKKFLDVDKFDTTNTQVCFLNGQRTLSYRVLSAAGSPLLVDLFAWKLKLVNMQHRFMQTCFGFLPISLIQAGC